MPRRTKSSAAWLTEHENDPYVKRAREQGWRSRAVFKPGMTIVDLGAAPGGWSQYAAKLLGGKGRIVALDLLDMPPLPGVEFIQGDFNDEAVLTALLERLGPGRAV